MTRTTGTFRARPDADGNLIISIETHDGIATVQLTRLEARMLAQAILGEDQQQ